MNTHIFTVPHECLPQVKVKYPFIYLEHGRIEIDDRSVKFISIDGKVVSVPCGVINCILLGPGTSITHAAVKILSEYNCCVFWVGEEGLRFYAAGISPSATSKNFTRQMEYACSKVKSLEVVRKMLSSRFPDADLKDKSLAQMRGMEGIRVKDLYRSLAKEFKVDWEIRDANLTEFSVKDDTNKYIDVFNMFLYAIVCSATLSMGFSPYIGFLHRNSPLPFIYDIADLYKKELCIIPAFKMTDVIPYSKNAAMQAFLNNAQEFSLMKKIPNDLVNLFELKTEKSEKRLEEL